ILSGNRDIACATCHLPSQHAADGLSLAIGTGGSGGGPARTLGPGRQFVPRNAPSLLNGGLGLFYLFWDRQVARAGFGPPPPGPGGSGFVTPAGTLLPVVPNILAAQAMFPVINRREMRGERGDVDVFGNPNELAQYDDSQFVEIWQAIMRRLLALDAYKAKFAAAFPGIAPGQLGFQHAAASIAAFQMQAFTETNSPFDRYLNRDDAALTTAQKRGALLFFGKAQCSSCHNGPFLGGASFANAGVPQLGPGTGDAAPLDLGRGGLKDQSFYRFAFRVTPLRNVELTAPYMHDGAFPTLEAVVRHYNDVTLALRTYDVAQLAPELRPLYHGDDATIGAVLETLDFWLRRSLDLTDAEQRDLVEFLKVVRRQWVVGQFGADRDHAAARHLAMDMTSDTPFGHEQPPAALGLGRRRRRGGPGRDGRQGEQRYLAVQEAAVDRDRPLSGAGETQGGNVLPGPSSRRRRRCRGGDA